jgi:hypothetical protein
VAIQQRTVTIPIRHFTLVIRKSALATRYPGGVDAFRRRYRGAMEDADLIGVAAMAAPYLDQTIDTFRALGIDVKQSCAIADMLLGTMDPCPGIEIFRVSTPQDEFPAWRAKLRG